MPICPSCGQDNPDIARFCLACGATLAEAESTEVRKTVTILFADVAGFTAAGERLDAEALRRLQSRYFEAARTALERHGGTVEKFIGDAVMAVFGVPVAHEDDALRATRAALDLREAVAALELQARIGVNTGEVVVGAGEALATGDAVNVAARLEQAAPPGEVLIGAATYPLVRDAVEAEAVEPLQVKGKGEPLAAWKLLRAEALGPGVARSFDSPLVGRQRDLAALREAFHRARSRRACELVTVLGFAGAGKSRLAQELAASLADEATVLEGRCLPYGEGITFWPIAEIVKAAAAIGDGEAPEDALAKIAALLPAGDDAVQVSRRVWATLSYDADSAPLQETFWGVRRLFEALAADRPLVLIVDDLHWAEEALLDLVEYVAAWSTASPILLVCLARQELLDARPSLATPKANARALLLEPLDQAESAELIANVLGGGELDAAVHTRIAGAAEGNALFLEELLRMLVEAGALRRTDGRWTAAGDASALSIPPTIQALLAARLDRLSDGERGVVQRASVAGRTFYWGAVTELTPPPDRGAVGSHLQTLVRRELIRPDASSFAGEDAFSFGHILVRDAAYATVSKERRSELHERFAGWLEDKLGERASEVEEIVGYHLEQAVTLRQDLAPLDEEGRELAVLAGERLRSAGRRALARGDVVAASNLLGRAVELLRARDAPVELLVELAEPVRAAGDFTRARDLLAEAVDLARTRGDSRLEAHARIEQLMLSLDTEPSVDLDEVLRTAEEAFPVFEREGDALGLCKAWRAVADVHLTGCRWGSSADALERALEQAERAGDRRQVTIILNHLANALFWGPTPVQEAVPRCRELLARAEGERTVEANVLCYLAGLEAMEGRFDSARDHYRLGEAAFDDLGHRFGIAAHTLISGTVELLAGDAAAAERELRRGYEGLEAMGETGVLSSSAAFLAGALAAQERWSDAERMSEASERTSQRDDVASQVTWRLARAKALAARGESARAERLAAEAVESAAETDFLNLQGDAQLTLAEVLHAAGRADEAAAAVRTAVSLFERKGNVVSAGRARSLLVPQPLTSPARPPA